MGGSMRHTIIAVILAVAFLAPAALAQCGDCPAAKKAACGSASGSAGDSLGPEGTTYAKLPGFNKKVQLGDGRYFTYRFNKRPQVGTLSLIVKVYDKSGRQVKPYRVTAQYDMPSMKGAHDSGPQALRLNRLGDYLLPVSIVMRGEWEVKLVFSDKEGNPAYRGSFTFKI